eukprot:2840283-Rhodomonas_salina.1
MSVTGTDSVNAREHLSICSQGERTGRQEISGREYADHRSNLPLALAECLRFSVRLALVRFFFFFPRWTACAANFLTYHNAIEGGRKSKRPRKDGGGG